MHYIPPPITDTLQPRKVTPAWSLLRYLHVDRSSCRARKRWRSYHLIIPRQHIPLDPGRRSLTELSDELILLVVNHLQILSPESVPVLALVSSSFYRKARYVQHHEESIDLGKSEQEVSYLSYLATTALLPAIRTIRFDYFCWPPKESERIPTLLNELMDQMTGLRDIYWDSPRIRYLLPGSLVQNMKQRPRVRLHTSVVQDGLRGNTTRAIALQQMSDLAGSPNLYSLRAEVEHIDGTAAQETQPVMWRLKELLISCSNLRKLSLDIHNPRSGCMMEGLTDRYCGLGLTNGENLPPLEELEIIDYPWGHHQTLGTFHSGTIGYPETGKEEDYWAQHCDWSRLRRLTLPKSLLAKKITQKLTALEEISFRHRIRFQNMNGWDERDTVQFLQDLPTALESISVPNLPALGTGPIIRHGSRLHRLELLRSDHPYNDQWRESVVACEDLVRLRDGLPHLEELALDIAKDADDWSYKSLDLLASFPRLRNLKLTVGLATPEAKDQSPAPPYLTMASAQALFRYIREHSYSKDPPLQRLHVSSLGEVFGKRFWAEHNSTSFVVRKLAGHGDGAEKVTVRCTKLHEELNEKMRRIVRGEARPTPDEISWINFKVALDGPMSMARLDLMRKTDSHPYGFGPEETYPYFRLTRFLFKAVVSYGLLSRDHTSSKPDYNFNTKQLFIRVSLMFRAKSAYVISAVLEAVKVKIMKHIRLNTNPDYYTSSVQL